MQRSCGGHVMDMMCSISKAGVAGARTRAGGDQARSVAEGQIIPVIQKS